jgi:hypothetical protein
MRRIAFLLVAVLGLKSLLPSTGIAYPRFPGVRSRQHSLSLRWS